MTQEDKELLLKDLCVRLPYEVKVHIKGEYKTPRKVYTVYKEDKTITYFKGLDCFEEDIENVKPYLRPMSSMTFEERSYCLKRGGLGYDENDKLFDIYTNGLRYSVEVLDFLNSHQIDYRGLIEKGLALEAPEGMYNIK